MAKNLILGLTLTQIRSPKFIFAIFTITTCYALFQTIIVCNLKKTYWIKLEKMAKNLVFGPILALLTQIWAPKTILQDFTTTRW